MPLDRKYPASGISHDSRYLARLGFDSTQKVAVFWVTGFDTATLVGYYDTVSAANTAATAAKNADGAYPKVFINWWHTDVSHIRCGAVEHPDARESLPAWIDAAPAH